MISVTIPKNTLLRKRPSRSLSVLSRAWSVSCLSLWSPIVTEGWGFHPLSLLWQRDLAWTSQALQKAYVAQHDHGSGARTYEMQSNRRTMYKLVSSCRLPYLSLYRTLGRPVPLWPAVGLGGEGRWRRKFTSIYLARIFRRPRARSPAEEFGLAE